MNSIQYVPLGEKSFRCTVVVVHEGHSRHIELAVLDTDNDAAPVLEGYEDFRVNEALVGHLLNYGISEFAYRQASDASDRKALGKVAARHARGALQLAEYVVAGWFQMRRGWCSVCFTHGDHREVDSSSWPEIHLCAECGESTTPCAAVGCRNMARRSHGVIQVPPFCSEHRHEIRSFERADQRYASLDDIDDLREFDQPNLMSLRKKVVVAGVGVAIIAPIVFLAAPVIGGALGATGLIGPALSGAAATSHGLAFLGGGSIAAGGLGMAGGTSVIVAAGAALGGTLGAVTAAAYLQDDKSFRFEKLREGRGSPVIFATGFLSEGRDGWGDWARIIEDRYPENPVYRLHWGAKELGDLGAALGGIGGGALFGGVVRVFAAKAAKNGVNIVPGLGAAMVAADLVSNPWHVAKSRADQTASILADLLARIEGQSFILAGHSLGGRVVLRTAELLATKADGPYLEEVHALGAAAATREDWSGLEGSVTSKVWNYFSTNDKVLGIAYPIVQAGQKAVGSKGFDTDLPSLVDVDVSGEVSSHTDYVKVVELRRSAPELEPGD